MASRCRLRSCYRTRPPRRVLCVTTIVPGQRAFARAPGADSSIGTAVPSGGAIDHGEGRHSDSMTEILVTAGPTREHLDDVRFLSNPSTGRMGYAIAATAAAMGHRVHLVSGPVELPTPPGVERIDVISADDMLAASAAAFAGCSIAFFVAAVADHRPAQRVMGKPAKNLGRYTLELVQNPDIAAILGERKGERVCVGFALESFTDTDSRAAALDRARQKLVRKHLDLCVLNGPSALGGDTSEVILVAADGTVQPLPYGDKRDHARVLIERALAIASNRRTHTES